MRKLFAIIPLAALLLAGCVYHEMVKVEKCVKVAYTKYYQWGLFGRVYEYVVLADGREVFRDSREYIQGADHSRYFCTTEYKPKK
ncbi:MAG: hypothetical protein WAP51_01190 [Candidatus Sungiibacteriota bacterium]